MPHWNQAAIMYQYAVHEGRYFGSNRSNGLYRDKIEHQREGAHSFSADLRRTVKARRFNSVGKERCGDVGTPRAQLYPSVDPDRSQIPPRSSPEPLKSSWSASGTGSRYAGQNPQADIPNGLGPVPQERRRRPGDRLPNRRSNVHCEKEESSTHCQIS
jgi:hypothetical protein